MSDTVKITMAVNKLDLVFEPSITAFNKFTNEIMPDNKVAPATNYLRRIISKDTKDNLEKILALPGAAMKLAGEVNERYSPELEIEIKN